MLEEVELLAEVKFEEKEGESVELEGVNEGAEELEDVTEAGAEVAVLRREEEEDQRVASQVVRNGQMREEDHTETALESPTTSPLSKSWPAFSRCLRRMGCE